MSDEGMQQAIGRALSRIPSGLYILTAGHGPAATGMLASWVQQVGFAPPALIVALKKGRAMESLLHHSGEFCISVLDAASKPLLGHFARGFEPGADAFVGIDLAMSILGVPYPRAAVAHLACRVRCSVADWTDHTVVCGEVVGGEGALDREPLIHVRKNGLTY